MKLSAGLLVYKYHNDKLKVLLVHPGGPFWAKKDMASWSIPKGEYTEDEEPLAVAYREFKEETGQETPRGKPSELGSVKQPSGKLITTWAIKGDVDVSNVESNYFEMEWPPRSSQIQKFPEIDKAEWFDLKTAHLKILPGQKSFLEKLAALQRFNNKL
jgi:predicted NUDIX family NTP pyrophosphohydrolase